MPIQDHKYRHTYKMASIQTHNCSDNNDKCLFTLTINISGHDEYTTKKCLIEAQNDFDIYKCIITNLDYYNWAYMLDDGESKVTLTFVYSTISKSIEGIMQEANWQIILDDDSLIGTHFSDFLNKALLIFTNK
jgi:hypothetical protein